MFLHSAAALVLVLLKAADADGHIAGLGVGDAGEVLRPGEPPEGEAPRAGASIARSRRATS